MSTAGHVEVTDDDLAALIQIADASMSENGGTTSGTVSRNTDHQRAAVTLSAAIAGKPQCRRRSRFPGQATSTPFTISGVDDAIVDGPQKVTITASAAEHADSNRLIEVTDDDVATLASVDRR